MTKVAQEEEVEGKEKEAAYIRKCTYISKELNLSYEHPTFERKRPNFYKMCSVSNVFRTRYVTDRQQSSLSNTQHSAI